MTEAQQQEAILHSIEDALIAKMAEYYGATKVQMWSMIERSEEIRDFYTEMRSDLIKGLAEHIDA